MICNSLLSTTFALGLCFAGVKAQNGQPARGWNLSSFTGVNACAPVPVVLQPANDNTYAVSIYGDAKAANALNAYVKDGQVYVENEAPFNTASGVGVVLTMPADQLASVSNKGLGGSASLTAVSGFTSSALTVDTVAGSGPTVLGLNNATSSVFISHASSSSLSVAGSVGTINFSTTNSTSGVASFNSVVTAANLSVASPSQSVYVGGDLQVVVSGTSVGNVTYSNGTCSLSSGTCTEVPPLAVQNVTVPVFTGASVAQICSCAGGCVNPPPPPPPPPPPSPKPTPTPSPVGNSCKASTGPNCYACCENKYKNNQLAYWNDPDCSQNVLSRCYYSPLTPPSPPPPSPPSPVGQQCSSTGPSNCVQCCQNKYYNNRASYYNDSSCTSPLSRCRWSPYGPSPPTPSPAVGGCGSVSPSSKDACCAENPEDPACQSSNGFIGRKMLTAELN